VHLAVAEQSIQTIASGFDLCNHQAFQNFIYA